MEILLQCVNDPEGGDLVEQLKGVVDRYPWFTTARMALWRETGIPDPQLALHLILRGAPPLLLRTPTPADFMEMVKAPAEENTIAEVDLEARADGGVFSAQSDGLGAAEQVKNEVFADPSAPISPNFLEMIDHFLAQGQVRIRPAEESVEGVDMSIPSVREDPDLVSEALAEVYLAQGLPEKAREIYCKLGLLYPEKSAYFAEQIQRIG